MNNAIKEVKGVFEQEEEFRAEMIERRDKVRKLIEVFKNHKNTYSKPLLKDVMELFGEYIDYDEITEAINLS